MSTRKLLNRQLRTDQGERAEARRGLSRIQLAFASRMESKVIRSATAGKSFYTPHQGRREIARRARQIQLGKMRADT